MHPMMTFRQWIHHFHFAEHHPKVARIGHALHESRVRAIVLFSILLAFIVGFVIWAAMTGGLEGVQPRPYMPYRWYPY